jgi:hypothetical protein
MSSEMACPKCASTNVECQPTPHVHRCHACGFDGTCDSIDNLAILGSVLNQTIIERDALRALADDLAAVLKQATDWGYSAEVERVLARYRKARQP